MLKDQLFKAGRLQFANLLFGPEKFTGLSRNRPLVRNDIADLNGSLHKILVSLRPNDSPAQISKGRIGNRSVRQVKIQ